MTTRQVYANTVRNRIQRTPVNNGITNSVAGSSTNSSRRPTSSVVFRSGSYDDYDDSGDYNYSINQRLNPRPRTSYDVTPARVRHPTTEQMRLLRLNQFQSKYDSDKEAFKIKEEERRRKKLEEKLKRYKGVGELGNKLTQNNLTEEEKDSALWQSRDSYNSQYQNDANQAQLDKLKREEEKERLKAFERLSLQESAGNTADGVRLGGTPVNRVKGEHPLLKQLQK